MKWTWNVAIMLAVTTTAQAQPRMPERGVQIVRALYDKNVDMAKGADTQRRALTRKMIEQFICDFPDDGYTGKSADPGRPFSKDSIARRSEGRLYAWDWQNGSTREPHVNAGQVAGDITGQHPIPLGCVDHLGSTQPVPEPGPDPLPEEPGETLDKLVELYAEFQAFKLEVRAEWVAEATRLAELRASLEEHREESRKVRNQVLGYLSNWKNLAAIVGGVIAGVAAR